LDFYKIILFNQNIKNSSYSSFLKKNTVTNLPLLTTDLVRRFSASCIRRIARFESMKLVPNLVFTLGNDWHLLYSKAIKCAWTSSK